MSDESTSSDSNTGISSIPGQGNPEPSSLANSEGSEGVEGQTPEEQLEEIEAYGKKHRLTKDQMKRLAQKGFASDQKFREASTLRNEATQLKQQAADLLKALDENPFEVLKHLKGDKLRELAENYVYENLKYEQLDPREQKALDNERRLREYEEREQKSKQTEEQTYAQQQEEHYKQVYTQKIIESLETAQLPKTNDSARKALYYYNEAFKRGIEISPQQVGQLVRQDLEEETTSRFSSLEGEDLIKMLGQPVVDKINKALLAQHKQKNKSFMVPDTQPAMRESGNKKRHWMSEDEYDSRIRKIMED
jgi:hypothetical protein